MTSTLIKAPLLPAGLHDTLNPWAGHEATVIHRIMTYFYQNGFEQVKPPLAEFVETLPGAEIDHYGVESFRIIDSVSQRMMEIRADMTPQIARIASFRLKNRPRPLRLSYSGEVLRSKGSHLHPERQFIQAGIELIGSHLASADAEIISLICEVFNTLNLDISLDLSLPSLMATILKELSLSHEERQQLQNSINRKDSEQIKQQGGIHSETLAILLKATGPIEEALALLETLPAQNHHELDHLIKTYHLLKAAWPSLTITLDPLENRGFEYYTGLSFTIFSKKNSCELGRGGRYLTINGEDAVGATLYVDTILSLLEPQESPNRLYIPQDTDKELIQTLQGQGYITIKALDDEESVTAAKRLGCTHLLEGERIKVL